MKLNIKNQAFSLLVESCAFEGVRRIAGKIALDIEKVCGTQPEVKENLKGIGKSRVLFATLGQSLLVDELIKNGKFDDLEIKNKYEVYKTQIIKNPFPYEKEIDEILLICGSDKRGTIYGMFDLSEYIGVSPLHYWGDALPVCRDEIEIKSDIEKVSKEPSVRYRGFFINDEWPCFGNWTFKHFGGFTAEMYDNVFELLLRLKGNYLWPAMWTSSFPLDGPKELNEELADIYGVVMGASHHEPCLRASEEWDKVRGKSSCYGNAWNYYTNREGLLKYWEDGLKRSGKYEHIITIGMRGERDSSMLGPNATLKENIDLLKDIIKNQRELIKKHVNPDIKSVPQMLALYKEVEEYYYGNNDVEGLKDWDELDGVTCMLCEDNFGFMRTLPTEEIRNRKGGFGMYYHFDYHGGPVSYEWMPSTPYSKTWEQMSMAYDYGIRDIWIVNVGDLKFNEVPLTYFLSLAYDFENLGTSAINSQEKFVENWMEKTFPSVEKNIRNDMEQILTGYIRMNSYRRPEALNANIYHPCNYLEADRMLDMAKKIEDLNESVFAKLNGKEKDAFFSMIYFPAKSSINLLRLHLYAGKNAHFAKQGKVIANKYMNLVTECIDRDKNLCLEFAKFRDGKWEGMELEQHIGFTKWNDDNYQYPLRIQVEPAHTQRLVVSRKDSEKVAVKNYGSPMNIKVDDFMSEPNNQVIIEIANGGIGSLGYTIKIDGEQPDWLTLSQTEGNIETQDELIINCDRSKLPIDEEKVRILIMAGNTVVAVTVRGKAVCKETLPPMTFLANNGVVVIGANHYFSKQDTIKGKYTELADYGRSGFGMKVFPTTVDFTEEEENPTLKYRFLAEESGEYNVEIWTTPTNSVVNKRPLRLLVQNEAVETISADFRAGNNSDGKWCDGVMRQIRETKMKMNFVEGVNELSIAALEAGVVIEKILIYRKDNSLLPSYLGPTESFYVK